MEEKYFLYIDILGFADLVKSNPAQIEEIYKIIDSLNVHDHNAFKTIIFSDTILVYNRATPISDDDHRYIVGYACEFVQDLTYRLASKRVTFRAILTYGNFKNYHLKNIECYYGDALVNCYYKEKDINAMGLFIDSKIAKFCHWFNYTKYDNDFYFVCLLKNIDRLFDLTSGIIPCNGIMQIEPVDESRIIIELDVLKNIFENSIENTNTKVRSKYLQTYQLYKNMYNDMLLSFEKSNFDVTTIDPSADWSRFKS